MHAAGASSAYSSAPSPRTRTRASRSEMPVFRKACRSTAKPPRATNGAEAGGDRRCGRAAAHLRALLDAGDLAVAEHVADVCDDLGGEGGEEPRPAARRGGARQTAPKPATTRGRRGSRARASEAAIRKTSDSARVRWRWVFRANARSNATSPGRAEARDNPLVTRYRHLRPDREWQIERRRRRSRSGSRPSSCPRTRCRSTGACRS